jgi:hypothetical protein
MGFKLVAENGDRCRIRQNHPRPQVWSAFGTRPGWFPAWRLEPPLDTHVATGTYQLNFINATDDADFTRSFSAGQDLMVRHNRSPQRSPGGIPGYHYGQSGPAVSQQALDAKESNPVVPPKLFPCVGGFLSLSLKLGETQGSEAPAQEVGTANRFFCRRIPKIRSYGCRCELPSASHTWRAHTACTQVGIPFYPLLQFDRRHCF